MEVPRQVSDARRELIIFSHNIHLSYSIAVTLHASMMEGHDQTFNVVRAADAFGKAQPSPRDLAIHCGFTDAEADMLVAFWDPAFNGGWIYLTDEIIDDQLINKGGGTDKQKRSGRNNFYDRVLLAGDYKEDIDYRLVDETHPLVQIAQSVSASDLKHRGNLPDRRKYYIVTGETYKDLLARASTKRGRETRAYYRKVEQVAIFMRDLILEMTRREVAAQAKTIEIQQKGMLRLNRFAREFKHRAISEFIYIATTAQYSAQMHFKVGGTTNENTFRKRFAGYMSGRPTADDFYPVYWRRVSRFKLVEDQIEAIVGEAREKNSKEFYVMRFDRLREIVDFVADHDNRGTEMFNTLLGGVIDDLAEGELDAPVLPIQMPDAAAVEIKDADAPPPNRLHEFIKANSAAIAAPDPARRAELAAQMMNLLIDCFDFDRDKAVERRLVWKTLADTLITQHVFKLFAASAKYETDDTISCARRSTSANSCKSNESSRAKQRT